MTNKTSVYPGYSESEWKSRFASTTIEFVDPEQLLAHPDNHRIHVQLQQAQVEKLLDVLGWVDVVKVNKRTGCVVDGHLRVTLAIRHKTPVPVLWLDLSEAEERAALTSLDYTASKAGLDLNILATNLDFMQIEFPALDVVWENFKIDFELNGSGNEPGDAEPQLDRAAELQEQWRVQPGELFEIGTHRLICGDCTDAAIVARLMGGEKAEMVLTDPPYNVDYTGNYIQSGKILGEGEKIWEDKSFNDKIENFPEWLNNCYRVFDGFMENGCAVYVWHPGGAEGRHFWSAWLWDEWHFQVDLVWNKLSLIISRWDYKPQHEPCMYGWKGTNRKWIGANNEPTVWDYPRQQGTSGGKREHPTEKPLSLFQRCIGNHDATFILDPFLGSGTTLVACENLSRRGRGIEISPAYCAVILQRMSDAFPGLEITRHPHL